MRPYSAVLLTAVMIATTAAVAPMAAPPAAGLVALPSPMDFGRRGLNRPRAIDLALVARISQPGVSYVIRSIRLVSGRNFRFDPPPTPGWQRLDRSTPMVPITVTFRPVQLEFLDDTLLVDWDSVPGREGAAALHQLRVPLSGYGECTTTAADCDPIGPLCSIDANAENYLEVRIPRYAENVQPPLERHYRAHRTAVSSYTLPIDFFWEAIGLSQLMDPPAMGCNCSRDISFTTVPATRTKATFAWAGAAFSLTSKPLPGVPSIVIAMPAEVRGVSLVGAGYSEFHFSDDAHSPSLTITDNGTTVFQGPLACMSSTTAAAAVRQFMPGPTLPHQNLRVRP